MRPVRLDPGNVELAQPVTVRVEEVVTEAERRIVRPDVRDVEAEPGVRESREGGFDQRRAANAANVSPRSSASRPKSLTTSMFSKTARDPSSRTHPWSR